MPGFFDLTDPQSSLPLLGLLQGLGEASMPTRVPMGFGAVLGDAAKGLAGGYQAQQQQQLTSADIATKQMALKRMQNWQNMFGGAGGAKPATDASGVVAAPTTPTDATAAPTTPAAATPADMTASPATAGATAAPPAAGITTPTPAAPTDAVGGDWSRQDAIDFFNNNVSKWEGSALVTDSNGHPVKYGINGKYYGDHNIANMTQDKAANIFADNYAAPAGLSKPLAMAYSDTAFMSGKPQADQMLQASGGDPAKFLQLRQDRLDQLAADPSGRWSKYANAWTKRTDQLRTAMGISGDGTTPTATTGGGGTTTGPDYSAPAPTTNIAGMPIPKPNQSLADYVQSLPTYKRQLLAAMDPDTGMAQLLKDMNAPRELSGPELKQFLTNHPHLNPNDTYGYDPSTSQYTTLFKSGLKSKEELDQETDLRQKEAIARYGAPLESIKDTNPQYIEDQAHAIATYSAAAPTNIAGRVNPISAAIMERVHEINPNWDQKYYGLNNKLLQSFNASTGDGLKVASLNSAIQHLDLLDRVADAVNSHNPRLINAVKNEWATEFGTTPLPNDLKLLSGFVTQEVMKAVAGGNTGVGERGSAASSVAADLSKGQIKDAAGTLRGLMAGQMNALRQKFVSGMYGIPKEQSGAMFDDKLLPATKSALSGSPLPPSMQVTVPAPVKAKLQPGVTIVRTGKSGKTSVYQDSNGNVWDAMGRPMQQ